MRKRTIAAILAAALLCGCSGKPPKNERPKTRTEQIEALLSTWDGSHDGLVKAVKGSMNDPSSFSHVETRYRDHGSYVFLRMTFRGTNGFGATVTQTANASITNEGKLTQWKIGQ